ncbi:MAG TPA: iron-containing alcohol dehydrogenase [Phycisphaerae bacterium]|jgi:alcohol dehydrogenase class IV|nr:iron-containing alcohol dehydrogenase [Phycisphaerae bacterium]HOB75889.1 iron-containing alcohol dehydrogenase [Phycisphaerae bacterium]HOJ54424.1 iron-containing alcohol dehydrogenase [Phycisphaerae bacterium]HOL26261.1 iron-containing alcohol dehydrogenase [Phycisphaerae bacterium]HPP20785.1 iron-containing alcohol dehydrogenase [Phycisphaerae bacterium]
MRFEFATATRIVFGPGTLKEAGPAAAEMLNGNGEARVLIVTGRSEQRARPLVDLLSRHSLESLTYPIEGEPTVEKIRAGAAVARKLNAGLIIGFGGGSAIDSAKAIAAMTANEGDLLDYLEVIGKGLALPRPPLPCIAIPTTAGTGSEVTRNAVLASPEHRVKVSLRSPLMLPRLAIVDPELTYGLPPAVTAATGMDALTQLIEAFVGTRATPITDGLCREGIERAARALPRAYRNGSDVAAREDMCVASLFGGLALANAGLGAVHGFAGPLGGMFPAPHGAVCAALLPHVMAVNLQALRQRQPDSPALTRLDEVARMLTGRADATAEQGVAWIRELCRELAIPPLRTYGLGPDDIPVLVEKARAASSMKPNPIALTTEELARIVTEAL